MSLFKPVTSSEKKIKKFYDFKLSEVVFPKARQFLTMLHESLNHFYVRYVSNLGLNLDLFLRTKYFPIDIDATVAPKMIIFYEKQARES